MKKFLITYDLKNVPPGAYLPLHEVIKRTGSAWWHYLESTWIVKSTSTPAQIRASILTGFSFKQGDRLFVVEIVAPYDGWLPKDAWDWLNS